MSYLYTYRSRLNAYGVSSQDSTMTDSKSILDDSIDSSPLKSTIQINGIDVNVLITQGKNANYKNVVFKSGADYVTGEIAVMDGDNWLLTEIKPNLIHKTAVAQLCNSTLTIPGDTTKTQTGTDWRDAPVYDETTTSPTLLPCIAESKVYLSQGENQEPINLPNGRILVTIPYTDNSKVKLNFEFEMYGHKFITVHVDRSQIINNAGIIQLTADLI
jgi:hypothetical protein